MGSVTRLGEVSLFDYFYPIISDVKVSFASQFAQKQVIGDYTKDSEKVTSSWVSSDHRGGFGIKNMEETKDFDRCYWSEGLELGFRDHLFAAEHLYTCNAPAGGPADVTVLIEYANELYAAFGTDVRKWVEATTSWSASLKTLMSTPTAAIVHKSKLYFACTTDFERFDGAAWTTGVVLSGVAKPVILFLEWDGKLFILSNAGAFSYTLNEGVAFTAHASSTLEAGMFNSLFNYEDEAGTILPHLGTKVGVYILDYENEKWQETGLVFPQHDYGCKGAAVWRGAAYISVGMGVYQYQIVGGTAVVTPMGPDRDYGVGSAYEGYIIKLLPEFNNLYALVHYIGTNKSSLMKWNGKGWATVYVSTNKDINTGFIGTPDGLYRLWINEDAVVYRIPLNANLRNSLEISGSVFSDTGTIIWPWFDADNATVEKLAVEVSVYVEKATATEYIMLYYGTNNDDSTWTLLTNTTFPDGKIDSNGLAEFTFPAIAIGYSTCTGLLFKAMRFKAIFTQGSILNTADLRWLRLSYVKLINPQWEFKFIIDCTKDYRHKRASTLLANLKTAVEVGALGTFSYRTFLGTSETYQVKITGMSGETQAGRLKEGQYLVSVVSL